MAISKNLISSVIGLLILHFHGYLCDIRISNQDLSLTINENEVIYLYITNYTDPIKKIDFVVQHTDIVSVQPLTIDISSRNQNVTLNVTGTGPGHSDIYANSTNRENLKDVYFKVTVKHSGHLDTFSTVIGWIYFVAWSVSFYPQIYINYKRKSVVGLNFDFLALNLIGFSLYSLFNLGLYFIPEVKQEYFDRHPRGLNPVLVNDIVFACHAALATVVTLIQCRFYERDGQRVSNTARVIIAIFAVFLLISIILSATSVIVWLDFLYYCSYVKLAITLIKYVPQAYMNYKRKSTVGWSIGNVFLDFTGGMLSMLQMIINSYNYDDWVSIFGDPTKFGLGLFSVVFDIFFIIQHYILYKHTGYEEKC